MPTPGVDSPIQRVPSGFPGPGRDRLFALRPRRVRWQPPRVLLHVDDAEHSGRCRIDRLTGRDSELPHQTRALVVPQLVRTAANDDHRRRSCATVRAGCSVLTATRIRRICGDCSARTIRCAVRLAQDLDARPLLRELRTKALEPLSSASVAVPRRACPERLRTAAPPGCPPPGRARPPSRPSRREPAAHRRRSSRWRRSGPGGASTPGRRRRAGPARAKAGRAPPAPARSTSPRPEPPRA